MAFALVTKGGQVTADTNGFTTSSFNSTGGNLLVVIATSLTTIAATIIDNKTSSFTSVGLGDFFHRFGFWYADITTTAGTGHTLSVTGSGNFPALYYYVFSGALWPGALEIATAQIGAESGATTITQPGPTTPSQDNSLIIAGLGYANSVTWSINGGFSTPDAAQGVPGVSYGTAGSYLIQTTAAAFNPTWTGTGGEDLDEMEIIFKAAPATATLTGTASAGMTEVEVVAGGKTIILTVTGDTFIPI